MNTSLQNPNLDELLDAVRVPSEVCIADVMANCQQKANALQFHRAFEEMANRECRDLDAKRDSHGMDGIFFTREFVRERLKNRALDLSVFMKFCSDDVSLLMLVSYGDGAQVDEFITHAVVNEVNRNDDDEVTEYINSLCELFAKKFLSTHPECRDPLFEQIRAEATTINYEEGHARAPAMKVKFLIEYLLYRIKRRYLTRLYKIFGVDASPAILKQREGYSFLVQNEW